MNPLKPLMISLLALTAGPLFSQQIHRLEIQKPIPEISDRASTRIELYVPLDLTGFDVNNPIDFSKSTIALMQDDQGRNLLSAQTEKNPTESKTTDPSIEEIIRFGSVADYSNNKDIYLEINTETVPSEGAQSIKIKGSVALNFTDFENQSSATVKNIPVEMPYNSEGFETKIGLVKIEGAGRAYVDDISIQKYRVIGLETPIIAVKVSGDDSEELRSMGVGMQKNEFAFKEAPETVDIEVTYGKARKVDIPLDLNFSLGL